MNPNGLPKDELPGRVWVQPFCSGWNIGLWVRVRASDECEDVSVMLRFVALFLGALRFSELSERMPCANSGIPKPHMALFINDSSLPGTIKHGTLKP